MSNKHMFEQLILRKFSFRSKHVKIIGKNNFFRISLQQNMPQFLSQVPHKHEKY